MDKQLVFITGVALLIVLPIAVFILNSIDRKDKMKNNIGTALAKKPVKNLYYKLYKFLHKNRLTSNYVDKISRRYELLYPGDFNDIAKKTIHSVGLTWIFCAMAIILIFFKNMNFNNTVVSLLLVYVINTEVIGFMVMYTEIKLMENMAIFLSEVRHNFYINRMVDDAILLTIKDTTSIEMKAHANKLYEILISSNLKDEVVNYNATMHNKYLKMFLSQCINIMEYSDKTVNGQNIFTSNLDNLKKEINIEILKLKKTRYKFSGISFVTIIVCIPIDVIKDYGIFMMPELEGFYNGKLGIIYVTATILIALAIYLLNNRLKGINRPLSSNYSYLKRIEKIKIVKKALDNYMEKHYTKMLKLKDLLKRIGETISPRQLLLQRILFAIAICIISIVFGFYLQEVNKRNISHKISTLPENIAATNTKQTDLVKETILKYIEKYKDEENFDEETILIRLSKEGIFYNTKINEAMAEVIVQRVRLFKQEYFKWYELLICIGLSVMAYFAPYWMILYKKRVLQLNMEDEVNQLNSIIYMLMYNDHITVKDLLEEMELFATVFKQSIQECINDYNSGDIEALECMKEREAFGPFKRLVDNLIRCDTVAIYKAFDEVASDRENYHDRRKLENEISVQNRADKAQLIAYIPTVLVMIYLVLPLVMSSIKELKTFQEMMQNI